MRQSRNFSLRWAIVLATFLVAALAPATAQAGTGGASAFSTSSKGATTTSVGIPGDLAFTAWRSAGASWYGPGLYGNSTACGKRLRPKTLGVAHKSLPCGTVVKFKHRGHVLVTRVIDRGPYISGRSWDLTEAASEALDFEAVGVGRLRYSIGSRNGEGEAYARQSRRSRR